MPIAIIRYGTEEGLATAETDLDAFTIRSFTLEWKEQRKAPEKGKTVRFGVRDTSGRILVIDPRTIISIETKEDSPPSGTSS